MQNFGRFKKSQENTQLITPFLKFSERRSTCTSKTLHKYIYHKCFLFVKCSYQVLRFTRKACLFWMTCFQIAVLRPKYGPNKVNSHILGVSFHIPVHPVPTISKYPSVNLLNIGKEEKMKIYFSGPIPGGYSGFQVTGMIERFFWV